MIKKPICILGTTASGKTEFSIELAKVFINNDIDVAIVSLDAFQVYKYMDIGTGKIDKNHMQDIPHFGIDIVEPDQDYSVVEFSKYFKKIKNQLNENTQIIFVGGTALYIRSIVDDFKFPPEDKGIRSELIKKYKDDTALAYKDLSELDYEAASKIDPNNERRIIRALEVIELTGNKFSSYRTDLDYFPNTAYFFGLYQTRNIGRENICTRVEEMFNAGWIDETLSLLDKKISKTASKAIGYSQIINHLKNDTLSIEEIKNDIVNKTVQFSRRQRMWFKNDTRINWIFGDYKNYLNKISKDIYKIIINQ